MKKSAMCDLVGPILAPCPHYFVNEQLDDKLMLEIQSAVLDKKTEKNADSLLTMQGICFKERARDVRNTKIITIYNKKKEKNNTAHGELVDVKPIKQLTNHHSTTKTTENHATP